MIFVSTRSFQNLPRDLVAAVLASALVFTGCSQKRAATGSSTSGSRGAGGGAAPVLVGKVTRQVVPLVVDAIGIVEPIRLATVRAQITGTLFKIDIHEGQDVAQGDLLFEIDPRPFENALKSALADQQRIAVQLETARTQVARYKALNVGSMISQEQFQQIQDTARTLEAQQAASEAAVATARLNLSYCSIRAPIAGRTGNLNVHEGDMIRANDAGALVTINQLSPIYVTFGLAQQHLASVNAYREKGSLNVEVAPGSGETRPEAGTLSFVDNTVDPSTGTIRMKAMFPNRQRGLWPGQFTPVTLTLASPEVLTVPAGAIQTDQNGQHVFVVKEDATAEFRKVVVERTREDFAVVTKGLALGETVVTDGQLRVVSGRPVQVKPADILTNPGASTASEGGEHPQKKGKGKKQGT